MKTAGLLLAVAAVLVALPAFADPPPVQAAPAPSTGFFHRMLSVFDSPSATPDAGNAPTDARKKTSVGAGVEPAPMDASVGDTADKDSYKPDAGDAEH